MLGLFLLTVTVASEPGMTPEYDSISDSAAYLKAAEDVTLPAGERVAVRTGVMLLVDSEELCGQLSPNVLLAIDGVMMMDSGRLIDRWDTGEIRVLLWNTTGEEITISKGSRVARLSVSPQSHASYVTADKEYIQGARWADDAGAWIPWPGMQEINQDEPAIQWSDKPQIEDQGTGIHWAGVPELEVEAEEENGGFQI
jgi:dUTP pyrophosphatase